MISDGLASQNIRCALPSLVTSLYRTHWHINSRFSCRPQSL